MCFAAVRFEGAVADMMLEPDEGLIPLHEKSAIDCVTTPDPVVAVTEHEGNAQISSPVVAKSSVSRRPSSCQYNDRAVERALATQALSQQSQAPSREEAHLFSSSPWVPPAVVPPKGITGIFDDYDPTAILDTSKFQSSMVLLNVYDIGDTELFQKINKAATMNNNFLVGGVFHAGVEVYGEEWCYGFTEDGSSGVSRIMPRSHPQHTYRTTVPMGQTRLNHEEVYTLLARLTGEWPGNHYNLIHHNCLSFCNGLNAELGVGRIPGWIDRAARTASFIDDTSRTAVERANQTAELARSISTDLQEAAKPHLDFVQSSMPANTDEAQTKALEAIEVARRESVKLAEAASTTAAELGSTTISQAQVLGEATVAQAQVLGEATVAQAQVLGEVTLQQAQVLGEAAQEHGQVIGQKVQEHAEIISRHASVIGDSLWSWGSGLRDAAAKALGDDQPSAATTRSAQRTKRSASAADAGSTDLLGDFFGFTGSGSAAATPGPPGDCFANPATVPFQPGAADSPAPRVGAGGSASSSKPRPAEENEPLISMDDDPFDNVDVGQPARPPLPRSRPAKADTKIAEPSAPASWASSPALAAAPAPLRGEE